MKRYPHRLDHKVAGTINMGRCYPCDIFEVFPGESFKYQAENLTRLMPQISPTMTEVNLGIDFYQVPLRQLFDKLRQLGMNLNWDNFLTGGPKGNDTTVFPTITIPATGYDEGSIADWLNYPCNYLDPQTGNKVIVGAGLKLSAMPVICYMHIINENYLDRNFIEELDLTKYQDFIDGTYVFHDLDGNVISFPMAPLGIFRKAWQRDYFGRAQGSTQRGNLVQVPLSSTVAPVRSYTPNNLPTADQVQDTYLFNPNGSVAVGTVNRPLANGTNGHLNTFNVQNTNTMSITNLAQYADLSNVPAFDLITFRLAARMQQFGEVLKAAGSRAVEYTYRMFGVRIPDGRVQRPIFHGSFKLPVIFSEVLQTSSTNSTSPQGNLAGHGITGGVNQPIHIKVIEHGFVMAIMHAMPLPQYQNVIPKYLLRDTRFSLPNPLFTHIGDQEILRKEIYPNSANPNEKWGFVPRYTELSFIPSTVHGQMKGALLHWTMVRTFATEPVLSAEFRYAEPSNRSFSVQTLTVGSAQTVVTADEMQVSIGFHVKARRMFPRDPQPGIHIV